MNYDQIKNRLKSILNGPEAKGRDELADYLAYETEYPAKLCLSILNAAPRGEVPHPQAPEPDTVKPAMSPKWCSKFYVK